MKKALMFLFALIILLTALPAYATGVDINLSQMDTSGLTTLYGEVLAEIGHRSVVTMDVASRADSPILFRNIEWGTSASDFLTAMKAQGISGSIRDAFSCASWEFKADDGKIVSVDSLEDCGYTYTCRPDDLSVGGFKVDSIEAFFLFGNDVKNVYPEQEKSQFYKAKYDFKIVDGQAAYEILSSKMSMLYGEGATGTNSTGWWSTGGNYHTFSDWTVWYGSNDTGVVLCHVYETYDADNTVKSDSVYLQYGKSNSLTMMSDLKAAQAREELESAVQSDDLGGL